LRVLSGKSYAPIVSGMLRRLKIAINERISGEIHRRGYGVSGAVRLYVRYLKGTSFSYEGPQYQA
jgi:hypothetical protein